MSKRGVETHDAPDVHPSESWALNTEAGLHVRVVEQNSVTKCEQDVYVQGPDDRNGRQSSEKGSLRLEVDESPLLDDDRDESIRREQHQQPGGRLERGKLDKVTKLAAD